MTKLFLLALGLIAVVSCQATTTVTQSQTCILTGVPGQADESVTTSTGMCSLTGSGPGYLSTASAASMSSGGGGGGGGSNTVGVSASGQSAGGSGYNPSLCGISTCGVGESSQSVQVGVTLYSSGPARSGLAVVSASSSFTSYGNASIGAGASVGGSGIQLFTQGSDNTTVMVPLGGAITFTVFESTSAMGDGVTGQYAHADAFANVSLSAQIYEADGVTPVALSDAGPPAEYVINGTQIEVFNSTGTFQFQFGGTGAGPGQFQLPSGITVDSGGNIWVTDAVLNRVQKFDSHGNFLLTFGSTGTAPGFLYQPYGIAVDPNGNIWLADTGNNRIEQFGPTGNFLQQFGVLGGGNGQFYRPAGIAVDSASNIWVADTGSNRIQKFSAVGGSAGVASTVSFLLKFGSYGNATGYLNGPFGISADPSGNVWVADSQNQRIQEFNSGGNFVQSVLGPFSFPSPYGVAVDSAGDIWAVDYNTNQVLEFTSTTGAKSLSFGTTGGGAGQLFHPTYIAVH